MTWKFTLAAIAATTMSPAAEAAVVLVTYTGNVRSGTDHTNFFGTGNTDLTGQAFTLQFTLDSATPGALTNCQPNPRFCSIEGQFAANPLTTRFTINRVSRSWGDSTFFSEGYADQYNEAGTLGEDEVSHVSLDRVDANEEDGVSIRIASTVNNIVGSTDFTDPLDYLVQSGDTTSGSFSTFDRDPLTGVFSRRVSARLLPTRVMIAPLAAAVPEPSTWAMLIIGFGLVGAAIRRGPKVHLVTT